MSPAVAGRDVDRSTLPLSEVARHVVIPEGIVDTLWFQVEERCREFGDTFDTWQDGLGQVILGLREDGTWAATVGGVVIAIPRQVAKTFIVGRIVVALCTIFPGLTVLWTAHRGRTSTKTFESLKAMVRRRAVKQHLQPSRNDGIRGTNGEQEIRFRNGSVIMFGAREQGFGRGFDEVDIEVFDEAQILTESALEDMVPATNQSRWRHGALLFFMGTPPRPRDPGEEFANRRKDALATKPDDVVVTEAGNTLYVECSADPDVGQPGGPSLDDPEQIKKANPSYPHRTPPMSVARLRANLKSDDSWRREGLGVWDEDTAATVIKSSQWGDLAIDADIAPTEGPVGYGVKFSADGERVGCGVARLAEDGSEHVEALGVARTSDGTAALVAWLAARAHLGRILIDGKAGAGDLLNELRAAGVPRRRVAVMTTDEAITAHTGFLRAVHEGSLTHIAQPGLDAAVKIAGKRKIGQAGGWGWQAVTSDGDVTALDAVTIARHAVVTDKRAAAAGRAPSGGRTAGGNRTSGRRAGVVVS
ncbi:terminase [Cellulomonas hominis]|uniref:Terminase n=1 Tax=Cellulomonas hominis TaxID=156981 RepID=A0A7W8SCC4_9CELL|nr:terminase [Cellulomonas hominis]MBB5472496.1 hypothetical protein [Cellulomonas hominis]NKY05524.1 terminase [Cellulomonas hominis]